MYLDVVSISDGKLLDEMHKVGFNRILILESNRLHDAEKVGFNLTVYSGADPRVAIQKHKADIITDLELNGVLLNRGLCSKLKENNMFIIFKLKNLIAADAFFKTYKNILINSKLCYDFDVNCLFVSFSSNSGEIKAPIQLIAFAEHMGYHIDLLLKSYYNIEKLL